ncbi:MAG: right-handed parallel beta-helix repeat-containing protein [Chthoniobacterales bacterium]
MKKTYFLLVVLIFSAPLYAEEIHSKGLGGGDWSNPNTWTKGKVPQAADVAVIAARDVVIFDRNDADKPTCASLLIDPSGALIFQTNQTGEKHPIIMNVAGIIESYGSIKIDASDDDKTHMELRLAGPDNASRKLSILRGGSLAVVGRSDLPENKCNVIISAPPLVPQSELGIITAEKNTMLDIQHAQIEYIRIDATNIDNTGSKPNERLNLISNMFARSSCLNLTGCDTPAILKNIFTPEPVNPMALAILNVAGCPLADIRDNKLTGPARWGLQVRGECSATGNTIEKCINGISWTSPNGMMKRNTVKDCESGIQLTSMTGSIEDTSIENCKLAIESTSSVAQLTNVRISDSKTPTVTLVSSSLSLLNCDIKKAQIKTTGAPNTQPELPWVQAMQFVVVKLTGKVPDNVVVDIKTAKPDKPLAPGAMDLNVRNSPAIVRSDTTPPADSPSALVVNTWGIARDGKALGPIDYTLTVMEPAAKATDKPKILKTLAIKPEDSWYRSEISDSKPTLEVNIP